MVSETEVTVRGRIGNHPELQSVTGKKPWLRLRLATNRRMRVADGWVDGPTSWYDVKLWDAFAQNVAQSLRKGDAVLVQGSLFIEEYLNDAGVTLRNPVIHAHALGPDLRQATAQVARVNRSAPASGDEAGAGSRPGADTDRGEGADADGKGARPPRFDPGESSAGPESLTAAAGDRVDVSRMAEVEA
ncbi:MAG: single-stranded DNA-binding protein [Beutenbergiaceae bacterium]